MEWLKRLGAAIDYIEENLDKEISYDEAAHIACCLTYYFQRIFSYVSGVSLSEYIRRRKMTQAAFELQRTDNKVIDVAHKYGYSSPTSFNRAFQSVHGIAPIAAKSMGCTLCAYPSIQFSIIVLGGSAMAYHIEEKKSIRCQYDDEPDFETVWSSIFDLDSLVIYRAEGDPRKKKFVTDNRLHDLIRRG